MQPTLNVTYGISVVRISARNIVRKGFVYGSDIVLIHTWDVNVMLWVAAATEIQEFFAQNNFDVQVEIQNDKRAYLDESLHFRYDQRVWAMIDSVRGEVLKRVMEVFGETWTSISYDMRGSCEKEPVPTCVVQCRSGTVLPFQYLEPYLRGALESASFPDVTLHLEIIPGRIDLYSRSDSKAKIYWELPEYSNNSSIGPKGSDDSGTLGGWVMLKKGKEKKKCILTCYHAIGHGILDHKMEDEEVEARQREQDNRGIGLNGATVPVQVPVLSPSQLDLRASLSAVLHSFNARKEDNDVKRKEQKTYRDLSERLRIPIGRVIFASGHRRTTNNSRLDWALVESPATFSKNKSPVGFSVSVRRYWNYEPNPNNDVTAFGEVMEGDFVVLGGRTSGPSSGTWEGIKEDIHWSDQIVSSEYKVLGLRDDFCQGGDSGSWVFNNREELIGICIGADAQGGNPGYGVVTPIEVVLDDIREQTGWEVSLS